MISITGLEPQRKFPRAATHQQLGKVEAILGKHYEGIFTALSASLLCAFCIGVWALRRRGIYRALLDVIWIVPHYFWCYHIHRNMPALGTQSFLIFGRCQAAPWPCIDFFNSRAGYTLKKYIRVLVLSRERRLKRNNTRGSHVAPRIKGDLDRV